MKRRKLVISRWVFSCLDADQKKKTVVIFRYLFAVFFRFMLLWFPYAVLIKGGGGSARLPVIVGEMNCLLL